MAKQPVTIPPSTPATACDISNLPKIIQGAGLVNFQVSCSNGELTVTGTNQSGQQVRINQYQGNGYTEGTLSTFQPSNIEARQNEARRLRSNGLTQQEIADRLGVSQKTISNDLK
ncbi:helix-turn-helix domain-containing protein [Vibrio fluvialis]|nr:helix-turn-helix domain-containing protein [Salmonella enterica]EJJ8986404.1 helix-turn-helix domain-containing protein [Salmonella enterica]